MPYCLPLVCAHSDVPAEAAAMAHRALLRLPEAVAGALWAAGYHRVFLRSFAAWDAPEHADRQPYYPDTKWTECGGYWDEDIGYAVINVDWIGGHQCNMDAVILHEFGHALSINVLGRPHRERPFREAWKVGRDRIRERWPADYGSKQGLGQFCLHWTRGVQEVWADGFAWMLGGRATTHPAFGEVFAECIELVRADVAAMD